jgi:hypothetical protein
LILAPGARIVPAFGFCFKTLALWPTMPFFVTVPSVQSAALILFLAALKVFRLSLGTTQCAGAAAAGGEADAGES